VSVELGDIESTHALSPRGWTFCKDHFAALINIEPTLVGNLKMRGQDVTIDYRNANVQDSMRFRLRLCRNGECLTKQDWACGFTNGDEEAFDRCFDMVEAKASPSITLDDARKYCGNLTMRFVGERHSTPEKCQAAGGNWAIKTVPPRLGL
jgi:hypothetical protein